MFHTKQVFLILVAILPFCVACGTTASEKKEERDKSYTELQERLKESEQKSKRLDKKIGRLEKVIAVTQDRIEAQTIASQYDFQAQHQPDPVPESRFSNGMGRSHRSYGRRRNGSYPRERRISLGQPYQSQPTTIDSVEYDDGYVEETHQAYNTEDVIVITQEDFDAFTSREGSSTYTPAQSRGGRRVAQPNVTDRRLSVSRTPVVADSSSRQTTFVPQESKGEGELQLYEEGLGFYRNGDFDRSLERFQTFLKTGPSPSYLDNALYWIGESYYGLNDMKMSIRFFKRVMTETPSGNKVPNAMLKMAIAYRNIGQNKTSKKYLKQVVDRFPTTGAGQIAKRELEK